MKGIDISAGRTVNFKALKKAGYDFCIFRAGKGSYVSQKDKSFDAYMTGAIEAGLHIGAYWFIYARSVSEAMKNAECFDEVLRPYREHIDLPVYIDYEYDSTRYYEQETGEKENKIFATSAIKMAVTEMQIRGWKTGVYLNPDYIKNRLNYDAIKEVSDSLWLAQWTKAAAPSMACDIWQYAGESYIPECVGSVDLNMCFKNFWDEAPQESPQPDDISIGGHGIYGRAIKIFDNGTWAFVDGK